MTFKNWVELNRLYQKEVASILGVCPMHIQNILKGRSYPSRKLALAIERITAGHVSRFEALFPDEDVAVEGLPDIGRFFRDDGVITDIDDYISIAHAIERGIDGKGEVSE